MPWLIGMDEAGYGPNLGPLVQAAVVLRVPDDGCIWRQLRAAVRRATDKDDGRLVIDDSKLVNAGPGGLARLERGVLSTATPTGPTLGEWLREIGRGETVNDLTMEAWFEPCECHPVVADNIEPARMAVAAACGDTNVEFAGFHCVVTPAARFNAIVERFDSKAVALGDGLMALLRATVKDGRADTVFIDKQGGRNFYAALLQCAFGDRWVTPIRESAAGSEYRAGDARIIFAPRAEQQSFAVALASMVAKYLRERFVRQFNKFWIGHVPGLRPTAGYPTDARRYFEAIRPTMERLGICESAVWRCR